MNKLERLIIKRFMVATIHALREIIRSYNEGAKKHLKVMEEQSRLIDNSSVINDEEDENSV